MFPQKQQDDLAVTSSWTTPNGTHAAACALFSVLAGDLWSTNHIRDGSEMRRGLCECFYRPGLWGTTEIRRVGQPDLVGQLRDDLPEGDYS